MCSMDRRSSVRADFPFRVKFNVMTREEYEGMRRSVGEIVDKGNKEYPPEISSSNERNNVSLLYASLIDFLVRIDDKLDRILALLSKDPSDDEVLFSQGTGESISGSGMTIKGGIPVELGQIVHAEFMLAKFPLTVIKVFGEVIWVSAVDEEDSRMYRAGIEFIDLYPNDRDRIIGCIFEKQRETNRKRKSEKNNSKDN